MIAPTVALNSGTAIPQLGLGTWPLTDRSVVPVILDAFEAGYRHIDTAVRYGNETGVGRAVAQSGLPREDIFITTKMDGAHQGGDRAIEGLDESLRRLDLDYVDLLLIHWPLPSRGLYVSTWRTFETLQVTGKVRAIGVSNFKPAHLERLARETSVVPAVNQVELSPYTPRRAEREYAAEHGIVVESYSPLGKGGSLLTTPQVAATSQKHGRTAAQVVLRWHVQQGLVAIPKSGDPTRLRQNLDVEDFELDEADLELLGALDRGPQAGVDSDVEGH